MGIDVNRFKGEVDEELLCPICSAVLENPLQVRKALYTSWRRTVKYSWILLQQAPNCEHAFCSACIHEWLSRQPTCPVDRQTITPPQLRPVPRILRNLLYRWQCRRIHPIDKTTFNIFFHADFNLLVIMQFMDAQPYWSLMRYSLTSRNVNSIQKGLCHVSQVVV